MRSHFTVTFLLALSAALAADPPAPVPGKVRVYLYLPSPGVFKIYADQAVVAKPRKWLKDKNHYWVADLDPGRHLFYAGSDVKHGVTAMLTLEREYFVSCHDESAAHPGVWIGRATIPCTLVDPEQGKSDIGKFTFRDPQEK